MWDEARWMGKVRVHDADEFPSRPAHAFDCRTSETSARVSNDYTQLEVEGLAESSRHPRRVVRGVVVHYHQIKFLFP